MIVPIVLGIGGGLAWWKHKKHSKGMTPKRKKIFEAVLRDPKVPPEQLLTIAKEFTAAGLKAEGNELKKRAAILTASPEVLEARKVAFKKGMNSTDPTAIKKLSEAFHRMGHYEASAKLRNYAKGLFGHTAPKL